MKKSLILALAFVLTGLQAKAQTITITIPVEHYQTCKMNMNEADGTKIIHHPAEYYGGGTPSPAYDAPEDQSLGAEIFGTDQYGTKLIWRSSFIADKFSNDDYPGKVHDIKRNAAYLKRNLISSGICPTVETKYRLSTAKK